MKNFACPRCRNTVYFESVGCVRCGERLGFDPDALSMVSLDGVGADGYSLYKLSGVKSRDLAYCANADHSVCNWLTPLNGVKGRCRACELNRTIPNLDDPRNLLAWRDLERAKKRLVYSVLRLRLPLKPGAAGKAPLTFDFAHDTVTGHFDGVITIDVSEADAVERERQRQIFGEPYRALLGHLRHESGHFYWMVLIDGSSLLEPFRALFGDERQNYQAALASHHSGPPLANWQARHVSSYAVSHPWEDWAETWAHYLHMIDALDTADAEFLEPRAPGLSFASLWPSSWRRRDVYRTETFEALLERWIPLTIAMNSISRSMGHDEFYPFVITPAVSEKLAFVHRVIRNHQ
jgi:hypothetical protein